MEKNLDEVKKILGQYIRIKNLIDDLEKQIKEIELDMASVKAVQVTGMPHGGNPYTFADKIADKDELERRKAKLEILAKQKKEIVQSYIDTVYSVRHNRFLTFYFIKNMSVYKIAKKEHYTDRHAFRILKDALNMVDLSLDL